MKNILNIILIYVFLTVQAFGIVPFKPLTDQFILGVGTATNDKSITVDIGDGASNPKILIDKTLKTFDFNKSLGVTGAGVFTGNISGVDGTFTGSLGVSGNTATFGDGTNTDKKQIWDIGAGANNPYLGYSATSNALVFNNGLIEKKIGSGTGGGAGGIEILDNAGFEDGVTIDWTCTAGKCTEESANPLDGEKSLIFTPTAQNNEFKSTLKAIKPGLMGRACESRVFYIGGDENLTAQVIDGNGLVLSEKILPTHSIASFESLFYLCPTQAEITGDSLKGDLSLKVFNETVTPAAVATFDNMRVGDLIGLVETVLPDVLSARIQNNGAASVISENSPFIQSVNRVSVGRVDITLKAGIFSVTPSIVLGNGDNALTTNLSASVVSSSSSLISILTGNDGVSAADRDFSITLTKQGVDAKQSVQVYKNIPKISENINDFSAVISAAGVVTNENVDWINGDCVVSGTSVFACSYISGFSTGALNCQAVPFQNAADLNAHVKLSSSTGFSSTTEINSTGALAAIDHVVTCQKQGIDFKTPTVQLQLVNQVETSVERGVKTESCRINNNGTATLDTVSGICASWIQSVSRTPSTGIVSITLVTGIFSSPPECTAGPVGAGIDKTRITSASTSTIGTLTFYENGTGGAVERDSDFVISCKGKR